MAYTQCSRFFSLLMKYRLDLGELEGIYVFCSICVEALNVAVNDFFDCSSHSTLFLHFDFYLVSLSIAVSVDNLCPQPALFLFCPLSALQLLLTLSIDYFIAFFRFNPHMTRNVATELQFFVIFTPNFGD